MMSAILYDVHAAPRLARAHREGSLESAGCSPAENISPQPYTMPQSLYAPALPSWMLHDMCPRQAMRRLPSGCRLMARSHCNVPARGREWKRVRGHGTAGYTRDIPFRDVIAAQ